MSWMPSPGTDAQIPVSTSLHPELGDERVRPDPTALHPHPVTVIQVCPLDEGRLAIVGVGPGSGCLHSLVVAQNLEDVVVDAFFGYRSHPIPAGGVDHVLHRVLWVAEIPLSRPLGLRPVRMTRWAAAAAGAEGNA